MKVRLFAKTGRHWSNFRPKTIGMELAARVVRSAGEGIPL
jgi:hypothetical protein